MGKIIYAFFVIFGIFFGNYVQIIGLKGGNYSASFWSTRISVLSCEGPKPNISMISGFLNPWSPVFMVYYSKNTSKNIRKYMGTSSTNIAFHIWTSMFFVKLGKDGHRKKMKIRLIKYSKS